MTVLSRSFLLSCVAFHGGPLDGLCISCGNCMVIDTASCLVDAETPSYSPPSTALDAQSSRLCHTTFCCCLFDRKKAKSTCNSALLYSGQSCRGFFCRPTHRFTRLTGLASLYLTQHKAGLKVVRGTKFPESRRISSGRRVHWGRGGGTAETFELRYNILICLSHISPLLQ